MFGLYLRAVVSAALIASLAPAMAQVVVSDAWVRGTVEGQTATGAYMTLSSAHEVTLVGIASDIAAHAAVHEMQMHGDMMTMRAVDRLPVPAGHPIALTEGRYHIMLENLKRTVKPGESVRLDLQFVDAHGLKQVVRVDATVRSLAGGDAGNSRGGK